MNPKKVREQATLYNQLFAGGRPEDADPSPAGGERGGEAEPGGAERQHGLSQFTGAPCVMSSRNLAFTF